MNPCALWLWLWIQNNPEQASLLGVFLVVLTVTLTVLCGAGLWLAWLWVCTDIAVAYPPHINSYMAAIMSASSEL